MRKIVSHTIQEDLVDVIAEKAAQLNKSKSWIIEQAVARFVGREDLLDEDNYDTTTEDKLAKTKNVHGSLIQKED